MAKTAIDLCLLKDPKQSPEVVFKVLIDACRDNRTVWAEDWAKNFPRLAGFTSYVVDEAQRHNMAGGTALPVEHEGPHLVLTSFNLLRNIFQRLVGRVSPVLTGQQVMAASTDKEDLEAASVASELLRTRMSVDSGRDFEESVRGISYLFGGGPAYMLVEPYKPFVGKKDVRIEAIMPFDVYYYPGIMHLQDSPAIVLIQRLTKQQIEERFPELADALDKNESWSQLPGATWPMNTKNAHIAPNIDKGLFEVRRLMVKPCRDFPKGREIVMVKGCRDAKADYPKLRSVFQDYPIEEISDIPLGPFIEDHGRMSEVRPMQDIIDECMGKLATTALQWPNVLLGLPPGMDEDELTGSPVKAYRKRGPGGDITIAEVPVAQSLFGIINMTRGFIDTLMSQSGPSRGEIQGERQSGRALESAIAADEQGDSPLIAMLRRTWGRIGKRIIAEGQRVWDKEYVFNVLGKNHRFERRAFFAANLKDGFDVRVLPDQGLPKSKAARMKLVSNALKEGMFSDTPEAKRAREALHLVVDDDHVNYRAAEDALIKQEEETLDSGESVPVGWFDDHPYHLERHKASAVQYAAHGADEGNPEVFVLSMQKKEEHAALHSEKVAESMKAQVNMEAGPPPPQGQPSA